MKLTLKLILILCLFSSVAFADGEMGSGGGEMGSGGKTCPTPAPCRPPVEPDETSDARPNQTDSVLTFIQEYLISIFG